MKKSSSMIAAFFIAALVLGACTKKHEETSTTTTTTTTTADTTAPSGDAVGVPECDDYIAKYEKCVNDKVPEMARAPMKDAFDKLRVSWKSAASTPEGKSALASGCKQALDAAKASMGSYGCEF